MSSLCSVLNARKLAKSVIKKRIQKVEDKLVTRKVFTRRCTRKEWRQSGTSPHTRSTFYCHVRRFSDPTSPACCSFIQIQETICSNSQNIEGLQCQTSGGIQWLGNDYGDLYVYLLGVYFSSVQWCREGRQTGANRVYHTPSFWYKHMSFQP